jgi:hypothetical protein
VRPENTDMNPDEMADIPIAVPVRRGDPRPPNTRYVRAVLLAIGALLAGVFGAAGYINPYAPDGTPKRMATHTQLGLAPCNFVEMTGKPCPACGMTTSFALLVRGDVRGSLGANWVGTALAAFWAGLLAWAVIGGLVGRPLFIPPGRGEVVLTVAVGVFLVLMLGRWGAIWIGG